MGPKVLQKRDGEWLRDKASDVTILQPLPNAAHLSHWRWRPRANTCKAYTKQWTNQNDKSPNKKQKLFCQEASQR